MTPAEINVAIAQWCGWKVVDIPFTPVHVNPDDKTCFTAEAEFHWRKCYPGSGVKSISPYATSLDAIAQAEARLTDEQKRAYLNQIGEQANPYPRNGNCMDYYPLITATALQRSTALLHAVGLWKEEA